jgi:excisionase family DNA binding protein
LKQELGRISPQTPEASGVSPRPTDRLTTDKRTTASTDRPMTPREVAAYLGLDEKTITRWARQGYLPAHPLGEGKRKFWRFLESELVPWLAAKTNGAAAA